ncbi:MAG: TonB-dependent receptor [Arcobacteraceae bacterium]|jgi:iron complex outermembrane receptor protein|nr:TonB-dependent receptor [Arcobacteraceae bacterium]
MKKRVCLSMLCASVLYANETITTDTLSVQESVNTKVVQNVSSEQIKSADLAEALMKNIPSISMVRRSGIANDIILRGQKKDNINILIDEAKIYGACPNRMDPPTSHVLSNNIESVKVIEGPYDVENFGTLSGLVQVKTKEPSKEIEGEVNLNAGSFGYKKASGTVSGGTDFVKFLVSASTEEGDQYKDGNGDDFLAQQKKAGVPATSQYANSDEEAFEKKTLLTKLYFNLTDNQDLKLSYTANRSDNILYPAGTMDADYDDSDIYTIGYTAKDLGDFSKELNVDYYYSKVDHPMSVRLRNNAVAMKDRTNHLKTSVWGTKVKNTMEIANSLVTVGLDTSVRNWRGRLYNNDLTTNTISLSSTDTTNKALFTTVEKSFGKLDLSFGARYDYTNIDVTDSTLNDRTYAALNANIFAVYNVDENTNYFAGIGKSARVPDARELYMGNPDLEDTKNYEVDLGFQKTIGDFSIKTKLFYSELKDYIYNTGAAGLTFENIDAKIYGLDISGAYFATDEISLDYGLAYQRGKKDGNYADKDLAEIAPLKATFGVNYEIQNSKLSAQVIAVDSWDSYDSSAKEQELGGYALLNLKYNHTLPKGFDVTVGVDNVFDKTYASTNTYQDIRYVELGGQPVVFNDMGRYAFINLRYKF